MQPPVHLPVMDQPCGTHCAAVCHSDLESAHLSFTRLAGIQCYALYSVPTLASGVLFNPKTVKSQIKGGIYSVKEDADDQLQLVRGCSSVHCSAMRVHPAVMDQLCAAALLSSLQLQI